MNFTFGFKFDLEEKISADAIYCKKNICFLFTLQFHDAAEAEQ